MNRRAFIGMAAAATAFPATGRDQIAPGAVDLADDIRIVRTALTLHPGLYRYNSPRRIEDRLARLERDWTSARDVAAKYLLLSRFLAAIRCGHSYCNFFNQKASLASELFDRPTRLPFRFAWIGDAMVVTADHSGTGQLSPGTRITRINGLRPIDMRAALLPYVRADGSNDAKRISLLEATGRDDIETFDVFQGLLFPPADGRHRIEAVQSDGRLVRTELATIGLAARRAAITRPDVRGDKPVWDWTMRPDGLAVLTMPNWGLYNSKWAWRPWLADRLDSLTGAKGLIVDIRSNEGGNDCGDPILARLIDRPLPPLFEERLRFERTPPEIDRYLDTWDKSFRLMGVGAKRLADGFLARPRPGYEALQPEARRIGVPIAVLTSPVNSSATFMFAARARETGRVRLYGQTTGGNLRGINGGAYFFVRLPQSGIEFDLPLVGYFPSRPQPDAGVVPDVAMAPTQADIANGRDPVMTRAIADMLRD